MNERTGGPPGGSRVNLSAGPSVSDIISEGALQPLLKKLQPRRAPHVAPGAFGACRKTTVASSFPFHLFPPIPSRSRFPFYLREILIYPWTLHILYPLSSQGRVTRYLSAARYRVRRRNYSARNCLFEIPTEIFARIINRRDRAAGFAGCHGGTTPAGRC